MIKTSNTPKVGKLAITPVMLAFFIMGFVDLVGTATNYVKPEFNLSDSTANLFTTMVFFWFLIFSVPAGILMNRIGRRKTVLLSIIITLASMALPVIGYLAFTDTARLVFVVASFAFLGIGNTFIQVSLNPLLTVFVKGDKLASTLTLGQFVKAFASLFAPFIASWGFSKLNMWWILFVIYLTVGIVSYVLLVFDKIEEPAPDTNTTTIIRCLKQLTNPVVLLCFLGIVAHVGVDVGINAQAPRILMAHFPDVAVNVATNATMVYFIARMVGCFSGGIVLQKISNKTGLRICGAIMTVSAACFAVFALSPINTMQWLFWLAVALIGFGNSNVFSLCLSHALLAMPDRQNEISGLMMMGLIGGAIFPPAMGLAADLIGQIGGILIMAMGCFYILAIAICYKALECRK